MRALLQKEISHEELRRDFADLPDFVRLLQRLYDGRLSDRNRALVILAKHRGVGRGLICAFLGICKLACLKYLRIFKHGGTTELFARQTKSSRKFDDEALKKAVFSLLHEPPSNYGINRTSWKMADFCRVLREKERSACREVIRKITKAAGYKWRKARVVLTSHDPTNAEKLDRIRTIHQPPPG